MEADFSTHRIEGFVNQSGTRVSIPLFTHITGNLWMGGSPVEELPREFKYAVNAYGSRYALWGGQTMILAQMDDSTGQPLDREHLLTLAHCIKRFMATGPTLVHCQAGLNRSGLLCALTLMIHGLSDEAAVAMLREKRCPEVLCNQHFRKWLNDEHLRMREGVIA